MAFNSPRNHGAVRIPANQPTWWNSLDEYGRQATGLVMLYGLPIVWASESGDVLAVTRNPTASAISIVPPWARTPGQLGAPVGFRHRLGFVESGPYVLQVGKDRAAVWAATRVTDAVWAGEVDDARTIAPVQAATLGFGCFLNAFGWISESRFVVCGFQAGSPGRLGVAVCRVDLRQENGAPSLVVVPEPTAWVGSGTENPAEWHGLVVPEGGQTPTVVVANLTSLWKVPCQAGSVDEKSVWRVGGPIPLCTRVISPLSERMQGFLCVTDWRNESGGQVRREVERFDLKGQDEMSRSPVISEPVDWARVVRTAGTTLLLAAREDGVIVARDFTSLGMADWARFEPPAGTTIVASTAGPDFVAALGLSVEKPFLLVAPIARGHQVYSSSEKSLGIELLKEWLYCAAGPNSIGILHRGSFRARADLFAVTTR